LPEEPRTTLNLGTIRGGTSVNSIPESAQAAIDFRSTDREQLLRLEVALHRAVEDAVAHWNTRAKTGAGSGENPLTYTIVKIGDRPAASCRTTLRCWRICGPWTGICGCTPICGWDRRMPIFRFSLGVPALSIGAGGEGGGAHTQAEWYSAKDRETGLRRVLLLTLAMLEWAAEQ